MLIVRTATLADREALGRFGGALTRQHYESDPRRFIRVDRPEDGYGQYLVTQIDGPATTVLVAELDGAAIGYIWTTLEDTNWMQLRGPCGIIQDIYVDPGARRVGAGRALMGAALDWIRGHGRTLVVLMTKTKNENAQHLFASVGFRPTMLEMTLNAGDGGKPNG